MSLAHSTTNDTRLADLMKFARETGSLIAQGKDGLPNLAIKVAYAAADGVISGDKDKDGVDDYTRVYTETVKTMSKKAVHEHTPNGLKANASKLRQIGMAACKPTCNFIDSIGNLISTREKLKADEVKVKVCYAAIVDAARTQLDQDDDLTPEQIDVLCRKPEPKEKDAMQEVQRAADILDNLVKGDKGLSDNSPEVIAALDSLNARLSQMKRAADYAELLAKAAELGVVVTPEVTATA
jgi:hypothetical protein